MGRIEEICALLRPAPVTADIGCDHGLVSLYAVKNGLGKVIASDISPISLKKASELLSPYKEATTLLSDGFDAYSDRVDQAVLSGMGGRKIMEILSRLDYRPQALVLGAQHDIFQLREYLINGGYAIVEDKCVFDRGKYYDIIRAELGSPDELDEISLELGKFYKRKNPHLLRFLLEQRGKVTGYKQTEANRRRLNMIEEALKWQE